MMKDKVGTTEQISFTLNGKPVNPGQPSTLMCPRCGVDRRSTDCPLSPDVTEMLMYCPMVGKPL